MRDRDNSIVKGVSIDGAILRPAMRAGYDSIRRGGDFDYAAAERDWGYERGRQFAICVRQVLGYIPPLPRGLDFVRPIYIALRLDGVLLPTQILPAMRHDYADASGRFSPEKYASLHFASDSGPSIVDSLF
jgi:hypothetical protein